MILQDFVPEIATYYLKALPDQVLARPLFYRIPSKDTTF
jgi:hypothetical protein